MKGVFYLYILLATWVVLASLEVVKVDGAEIARRRALTSSEQIFQGVVCKCEIRYDGITYTKHLSCSASYAPTGGAENCYCGTDFVTCPKDSMNERTITLTRVQYEELNPDNCAIFNPAFNNGQNSSCLASTSCPNAGVVRSIHDTVTSNTPTSQACKREQITMPCTNVDDPTLTCKCILGPVTCDPCPATPKQCTATTQCRAQIIQEGPPSAPCKPFSTQQCVATDCDCQLSNWFVAGECSNKCGEGMQQYRRHVLVAPRGNGQPCAPTIKYEPCTDMSFCPVDCEFTWSPWSTCTAPCGTGQRTRTKTITRHPANNGTTCGALTETEPCNTAPCSQNCEYTWGTWSDCSVSCGGGVRTRHINITNPATGTGTACPSSPEIETCGTTECPVDCVTGPWSSWSPYSASCGEARRTRTRGVQIPQKGSGAPCGPLEEFEDTNLGPCPCNITWSPWSGCNTAATPQRIQLDNGQIVCAFSTEERVAAAMQQLPGGQTCPTHVAPQRRACSALVVCPVDCQEGEWSPWSTCSQPCGPGTSTRHRSVVVHPEHGGRECVLSQTVECNLGVCPVDCVMNDWSEWGPCTGTCDTGTQSRTRTIHIHPVGTGAPCGPTVDHQTCHLSTPCNANCSVSEWSTWSPCTADCGGGVQHRTRNIISAPIGNGSCPALNETQTCNLTPCPVNCEYTWNAWTECSASCGGGVRTRNISITKPPNAYGIQCPHSPQYEECGTVQCPTPCTVSEWGPWSACTHECGSGVRTRSREITVQPTGGAQCPPLQESETCNTQPCTGVVQCEVGPWSDWSPCDKSCGSGLSTRNRTVTKPANHPEWECIEPSIQQQICNAQPCPVDCVAGPWSNWTVCSVSCGGGHRSRTAHINAPAQHGGKPCETYQSEECNTQPCPPSVDCRLSSWSNWSSCSANCTRSRDRTIEVPKQGTGKDCDRLHESQPCTDHPNCVSPGPGTGHCCCNNNINIHPTPVNVLSPVILTKTTTTTTTLWQPCHQTCHSPCSSTSSSSGIFSSSVSKIASILSSTTTTTTAPVVTTCNYGDWGQWSLCFVECRNGKKTGVRRRIRQHVGSDPHGHCGSHIQEEPCHVSISTTVSLDMSPHSVC